MPLNRQFDETDDLTAIGFDQQNFAAFGVAWRNLHIAKHDFSSHASNPSS
jgi:hypothetical protein